MASIQRVVSPLTGEVVYRVQVRRKGRPQESARFPSRKEAVAWAESLETAIREGRHFPHAAAKRTSFDALAKDYAETVLPEYDVKERATRMRQLTWWAKRFAGLSLADITADRISQARDALGAETFARGRPRKDPDTGQMIEPKTYKRSGATINRYLAALSHAVSLGR
jgi:hypothetical protein